MQREKREENVFVIWTLVKVEAVHALTVEFLLKAGEADHFFWALLGAAFLAAFLAGFLAAAFLAGFLAAGFLATFLGALLGAAFLAAVALARGILLIVKKDLIISHNQVLIYTLGTEIIIIKSKWVAENHLKICPGPHPRAGGSRGLKVPLTGQICKVVRTLKCLIYCKYWLPEGNVEMWLSKFIISNRSGSAPRGFFLGFSAVARGFLRPSWSEISQIGPKMTSL